MNINRHNYEEFFLLYVDNELSRAGCEEVEAFVQQNPDLLKELAMLQEAMLSIDEEMPLIDKTLLYKNEQAISLNNYEEYFLLYVDNELKPAEKEEVEKFVLQNPELQTGFTLLQQTKLPLEQVEFKDKGSLYKTEKERRVVYFNWTRVAAAAAVIGLVATLWIVYPGNKTEISTVASLNPPVKTVTETKRTQPAKQTQSNQQTAVAKTVTKKEIAIKKKQAPVTPANNLVAAKEKKKIPVRDYGNLNEHPTAENNPYIVSSEQNNIEARLNAAGDIATNKRSKGPDPSFVSSDKESERPRPLTRPAMYRELDTQPEEEKSILIAGMEINRNKVRGLFKKATKLFDRKATDDDETQKSLHIASFQIKTK